MNIDALRPGLEDFISAEMGSAARLSSVLESDGHAGLTFLFEVNEGNAHRRYVIKLPPSGVKLRGNTDVYRQAPLLRALKQAGLEVPDVPWAFRENPWFDVPFIVMERLPGRTFFVWDPDPLLPVAAADCARMWQQAVVWMARLHAFDWHRHLPDWETPTSLVREITRWEKIYAQAPDDNWLRAAEKTERALLDSVPEGTPLGLFHGDYQPGNCLFDGDEFVGVIDWELSGIGAQLLDVGWLSMVADTRVWTPGWLPLMPPTPTRIGEIYCAESGRDAAILPWFEALAAYRLAAISCLNVKLHRRGQRHDPMWENNARSVMPMFERAQNLIAAMA